jgi:hypothetical protein
VMSSAIINLNATTMKNRNVWLLVIGSLMLIPLTAVLFSFAPAPGGDSFTILLNDKVLVEQLVPRDKSIKTISLTDADGNDELKVNYSHCGKIGTARKIVFKDQSKPLKEFKYSDVKGNGLPTMSIKVKDIVALQKTGKVSLVYISDEMPEGKTLATLSLNDAKASLK